MLKRIGSLAVDSLDYNHEQIKALEKAGFTVILTLHTFGTDYYDIAKDSEDMRGEKNVSNT